MKLFSYLEENPAAYELIQRLLTVNYRLFLGELKRENFFVPGKSYLDVGCGTGFLRDYLENEDYTGLDLNPRYIAAARRKRGDCFQAGSALELTFLQRKFDRIIGVGLMHHLDDQQARAALVQFCLRLKADGEIFIIDALWPQNKNVVGRLLRRSDNGAFVRTLLKWETLFRETLTVHTLRAVKQWPFDYIIMRGTGKIEAPTA
ncbi:MAG TPA: class I SAM-dependent methyltransferase [Verrucomicrobiae bacterium]|nr:class I SAM-dependent methyltransferase [Verrucomicrobiae bacterium]